MKTLIEDKLTAIIQAVAAEYEDYVPQNYSRAIEDWDSVDQYPAITVAAMRRRGDRPAIQEKFYRWDCYIYVFSMEDDYDYATQVVEVVADRITAELEKNNVMESLTDTSTNEKVYELVVGDVDYHTEGFADNYNGVARIYLEVKSSKIGPF